MVKTSTGKCDFLTVVDSPNRDVSINGNFKLCPHGSRVGLAKCYSHEGFGPNGSFPVCIPEGSVDAVEILGADLTQTKEVNNNLGPYIRMSGGSLQGQVCSNDGPYFYTHTGMPLGELANLEGPPIGDFEGTTFCLPASRYYRRANQQTLPQSITIPVRADPLGNWGPQIPYYGPGCTTSNSTAAVSQSHQHNHTNKPIMDPSNHNIKSNTMTGCGHLHTFLPPSHNTSLTPVHKPESYSMVEMFRLRESPWAASSIAIMIIVVLLLLLLIAGVAVSITDASTLRNIKSKWSCVKRGNHMVCKPKTPHHKYTSRNIHVTTLDG